MEELIDILDENGEKTGEILTRKEVHKIGLWHRVIIVAIIDEKGKILMQQRSFKKESNPGKWDISVAGHVSSGQSSTQAALREVSEEVGIHLKDTDLKYVNTYKEEVKMRDDYISKHFYDFYIAKIKEIKMENIIIQESEVEKAKAVNKEEFKYIVENEDVVNRKGVYDYLLEYLSNM